VEVHLTPNSPDPAYHTPSEGIKSDIRALGLILEKCGAGGEFIGGMCGDVEGRGSA